MSGLPTVIAVGGLDPSGGAGVLADARAVLHAGAWPAVVCAVQTLQSTMGVQSFEGMAGVQPVDVGLVAAQLALLLDDMRVTVIKTGALGSKAMATLVLSELDRVAGRGLVVDPVMRPSRAEGGEVNLGGRAAVETMRMLAAQATLLTPNVPEAEALLGRHIEHEAHSREAALALLDLGPRAVLLKGGHLKRAPIVTDWLATGAGVRSIRRKRLDVAEVHGTGCTLASLIAGKLAGRGGKHVNDQDVVDAVMWAGRTMTNWMRRPQQVGGGMSVLVPRQGQGRQQG